MDYNTYPGCETMYWSQQQHPMICLPGQYQSFSPQDEHWTPWDQLISPQEQKIYPFQPQMNMLPTHLIRATSPQEMHQSYDHDRSARYVSPTASHHSSSISESSASTDHALTPNTTHQSTPFFSSTTPFPGQHTFRVSAVPLPQHTLWQSHNHDSYPVFHPQSNLHAFVPSRSSHSLSELDMVPHDDGDMTMIFGNEVDAVHSKSPMQAPQPEELELSDDQDDSTMSSVTDNDRATTSSRFSYQTQASDEETEEDEDVVTIDHESDSDYENRPTRRRSSRTTPRQKHTRKSSSNTVISSNSRIHKRTSSSSTMMPSTPTSTPRSHARRPSKTPRPKPKGPTFPVAKVLSTLPKTDRAYPCTFHRFGCTVEFPNKNEWKRHVACQHLQLGYFRCDLDGCNPDSTPSTTSSSRHGRRSTHNTARSHSQSDINGAADEIIKVYNDFNRKDLFTQHCRRMHGPTRNPALRSKPPSKKTGLLVPTAEEEAAFETQLTTIRSRCWHVRRPAPSRSSCGFCKKVFDAEYYNNYNSSGTTSTRHGKEMEANAEEKAWEERMEHVGRHYEKEGHDREEEEIDEDLVEWGVRTGVLRLLADGRPWLVSIEEPVEGDGEGVTSENGSGSGNASASGSGAEEEKERKKARRQPSRTVVREKRMSFEEGDTIVIRGSLD